MFMYEFMSGLVADPTPAVADEEEFDPHQHRRIARPTTYGDSMMHLLKGSLGAGVLAMPDAVSRVGVVFGSIGVTLIGAFAVYCIQLLIISQYTLCKKAKRGYMAYPKSMSAAIRCGPKWMHWSASMFYSLVNLMLIIWQLGICAVYFVFIAVNVKQVLDFYNYEVSVRILIAMTLPLQIIMNLIKNLKMLTPVSSISNFIQILAMILVFFYIIEEDIKLDESKFKIKSLMDVPVFAGITLFGLEAVGVVLAIEYNMEKPKQFTGVCGLFSFGMTMILGIFILLGVAGYLKYGDDIKASITLNLPQDHKKAQAAKLLFAASIFLSFPLQNFVAYQILWRRVLKRIKPKKTFCWDYSLRVLLVLVPFAAAVIAPNLGASIALLGALCLSLIAIVFPAIMDACIYYQPGYGPLRYKLLRDVAIIIIGMCALVSGVYTSLLEMAHDNT